MNTPPLILASSSPYRRALLERLQLPFECISPSIDESPQPGEGAAALVQRLAANKARVLMPDYPGRWIIGSDQVASLDGDILTKPHTPERAEAQLARCSGRSVRFFTGLCLLDSNNGDAQVLCETFDVHFRSLNSKEIAAYIDKEQPLDCAGSFRMEGLGIALFDRLEGRDPNSLIGLPLIALCDMLRHAGIDPLAQ